MTDPWVFFMVLDMEATTVRVIGPGQPAALD